jgi:predicted PurR-regulated permease PerM
MRLDVNLATLLAYGVLLAVLSWQVAAPFWAYIVLGLLLATLAFPVFGQLRAWTEAPRISSALTVTGTVLVLIAPLSLLAWRIVQDLTKLVGGLSVREVEELLLTMLTWSNETFGYPETVEETAGRELLREIIPSVQARLASWIPSALESTALFLVGVVITIVVMYYTLINGERFLQRLKDASPMNDRIEDRFLHEARDTVDGVIWGQVVNAGVQGALGWIAFFVTGIPNAVFWGFVMAVLSFLPVVGAFLIWAPAAVYLLAIGQTGLGVGMILWGTLVISSVDNIIRPMVVGKSSALHPLLAFVGVLGGLLAFGIMGFLMGPLVLSLFAVVFNLLADSEWDLSQLTGDDLSGEGGEEPDEDPEAVPG